MHRMKRFIISGVFIVMALLCAAPASLWAAEPSPTAESAPPAPSPGMEQVLRSANFLAQLKQFSVTLETGYDVVQESGQKIEFGENRKLTIARPDRFRADVERSDGEKSATVFDGKTVTVFTPKPNLYATADVPGDIDQAIIHFVKDLHMRLPMAMLFVTSLPKQLEQRILSADIVENSSLLGTPCVHVAGRGENVDFQLWIPTQGDPLPRKMVLTYKNEEGQPQYWAKFSEWNLSPNPPDSLFALDIPKDAARIQFLAQVPKPAKPEAKKGGKK